MRVFIGLGTNLGARKKYLQESVEFLKQNPAIQRLRISPVYETDPVGGPEGQGKYLNAVLEVRTELAPRELLDQLLKIEEKLGRKRSIKNAPRTLDLDLLFYGNEMIDEPGLTVPHPRLHERWFVLKPLADLAPDFVHPVLKKTVREMLNDLHVGAVREPPLRTRRNP